MRGSYNIWNSAGWDPVSMQPPCDETCKWHLMMSLPAGAHGDVYMPIRCVYCSCLVMTGIKWCYRVAS